MARGGMAEVWRAHHTLDDVAGAVKVLLPHRLDRPHHRQQFEQEGTVLAQLTHPGIVGIHERGRVDEAAAAASGGRLPAGAPYLVLDWLPHGSLWSYRGRIRWIAVRPLVRSVLDALGHAHGRGWIHRDLKPSNIIISRARRPVLADFGLANRAGQPVLMRAGTPSYMAPEQFRDQWRDLGPWTDLYGVGCLVWTLLTGDAPYPRKGWQAVREAHLSEPIPRLGVHDGPPELEGWLRELLHKDPAKRLQIAADAAHALDELEPPEPTRDDTIPTLDPVDGPIEPTLTEQQAVEFDAEPSLPPGEVAVGRHERPPPAVDDPRETERPRLLHLRETGLGLLADRTGALVGREAERRTLWDSLLAVHRVPLARVVVVTGPRGVGRSRLVLDLAHRAQELGMAWVLGANRATLASGSLSGLLRAHLGLEDEGPPDDVRLADVARRHGTSDPHDQAALDELVREEPATPSRLASLGRHLAALGARRPLVVVVDDPPDGPSGDRGALAALVEELLASRH
ncbi:MAG: serine/threonine-protein kinase, partial [Myxococcota bacterium]